MCPARPGAGPGSPRENEGLVQIDARRRLCALLTLGAAMILAAILPATARASVTAYPKPVFTKTAGNATFAFHWTNDFPGELYWLCGDVFVNGADVDPSEYILGPGSANCSDAMTAPSGDWVVQPFEPSTILQDGTTYDTCVFDVDEFDGFDYPGIPVCVSTTIDRDSPTLQVVLGGGASSTQSLAIPVQINYSSPVSPPWQGPGGLASNWDCSNLGGPCTPTGQPDAACSYPANGDSPATSFNCTFNLPATAPNGTYYFCVQAADDAVPDNPNGTNQLLNATSNNANLSAPTCGHISLNRVTGGGGGGGGGAGGCVVPKVTGRSLASAKALINHRGCRVGRVTRRRARHVSHGHVIAQSPPAGRRLAAHGAINLVIAR